MKNKNTGSKSSRPKLTKVSGTKSSSSQKSPSTKSSASTKNSLVAKNPNLKGDKKFARKADSANAASAKSVIQRIKDAQSSRAASGGKVVVAKGQKVASTNTGRVNPPAAGTKGDKAKLKLVPKGGGAIPVSKITRSEPRAFGSNVLSGSFGSDTTAKSGPALRPMVAEKGAATTAVVVEAVSFKVGDKIVYPGHGVGEIEGIRTTILGGQEHHIYNIQILDSGMKVMVPVSQATAVGLRRIIDKRTIDKVYEILRDRDFKIDTQTWNRRFREYSQKIKTGSVYEIAIVLRDLSVLSADKELSFGEKKMLDMAEALLVSEIAIAKARPHDKVVGELRSLFA